ncbi:MAG: hypothetical protein QOE14_1421, partial [Humisphaera sp.]|nr:hypothetical protein [Humisphaera sp.]
YTFRHVSATGEYTAFLSGLRDNPSTTGDGVYRWSAAAGVANVARLGQAAPDNGGTFNRFDHTHVTSSGGVAFEGQSRSGSNSYRGIYYKPADGPLRRLMRGGLDGLDGYAAWTINDAGQAAILATAPIVQYRILFHDGNALSTIAQGGIYSPPALNNSGDIAYSTNAIFLRSGASGTIARVVGEHDAAPGGGTIGYVSAPAINDAGQIAFHARLSDDRSGIYRTDAAGNTVLIARSDQAAPEGGGALGELTPVRGYKPNSFNSSHWAMPPAIAPGGQVAFMAYSADGIDAEAGIYLGDPSEVLFLTRWGHTLDGGVVTDFKLPPSNSFSFPSAKPLTVNEQGQIAMTVQLADGQTTTQLFTPTLHWRSATSGTWSDSANWTVGLAPAEVHPVIIDSPHGVIVTTPAGETKIKSLEVGVGNKLTLTTGSDLIVSSGGFVNIAGALAGSGTITGNVTNAGVIAPGNSAGAITIDGDYLQSGRLDLELLDGGFDQLIVTGDAILGGDVFVLGSAAVGDTFSFFTADNIIDNATWHLPGESTMQIVSLPSGQQGVQMTNVPETAGMRVA